MALSTFDFTFNYNFKLVRLVLLLTISLTIVLIGRSQDLNEHKEDSINCEGNTDVVMVDAFTLAKDVDWYSQVNLLDEGRELKNQPAEESTEEESSPEARVVMPEESNPSPSNVNGIIRVRKD